MAKIRLIGYIAETLGYREKNEKLNKPTRLRDVLKLPENISQERLIILVNQLPTSIDTTIKDGDDIVVMPVMGGG